MKVLLVDDEPAAITRLARLLQAHSNVTVIGEATNGRSAVSMIAALQPDLIFIDIQMPGFDGLTVLKRLPPDIDMPLVIFTTGYDQYALQAFASDALAYLLKPIDPKRLAKAVERAAQVLASTAIARDAQERTLEAKFEGKKLDSIVARKHNEIVLLRPSQILWLYVEEGIVRARTQSDSFWVNYHLTQLEEALAEKNFFRARRTHLVNLTKVVSIRQRERSTFVLIMSDDQRTELLVSERQARELRSRLPGL